MSVDYIGNGNDDGTDFGQSATDKIGFYGLTTPIVQPIISGAITQTAASNLYGFSQAQLDELYGTINLIRTQLLALGLMA